MYGISKNLVVYVIGIVVIVVRLYDVDFGGEFVWVVVVIVVVIAWFIVWFWFDFVVVDVIIVVIDVDGNGVIFVWCIFFG